MADESLQLELVAIRGSGIEDQPVPFHIFVSALQPDTEVRLAVHSKTEQEAIRII